MMNTQVIVVQAVIWVKWSRPVPVPTQALTLTVARLPGASRFSGRATEIFDWLARPNCKTEKDITILLSNTACMYRCTAFNI